MSVTSRLVEAKAAKGERFTLADLKAFAAALDRAGAAGSTPIDGAVTMGGHVKSLKANAEQVSDGSPG